MRILRYRLIPTIGVSVVIFISLFFGILIAESSPDPLNVQIEKRFEVAEESSQMFCGESLIYGSAALQDLYLDRLFQPAWISDEGPLPQVESFLNEVRKADLDGLKPEDYHLGHIMALVSEWRNSEDRCLCPLRVPFVEWPGRSGKTLSGLVCLSERLVSSRCCSRDSHLWQY
jgi:hypothetical protein